MIGNVNLRGAAVFKALSTKPLAGDSNESFGTIVAIDPEEYFILYYCQESVSNDERYEGVFISVRDPNISESRVKELLEMAN